VTGAFSTVSVFAGLLVGGVMLAGLSVLYDRGGGE
jgi:hypothetical protein